MGARGTGGQGDRGIGRGFTLIEVIVALTIGSAVVLMVHQAFGAMIDASARLDAARVNHTQQMHAREALEAAFGSLEIGFPGTAGFEGDPDRVAFSSEGRGDGGTGGPEVAGLVTIGVAGDWLVLRRAGHPDSLVPATSVGFDYLLSYGAQATWVQSWHSPASAPLAVRMRLLHGDASADTLFLLIGPRG